MLQWISAGAWETTGTHAFALPVTRFDPGGSGALSMEGALRAATVELAARRFVEDPSRWQQVIGEPGAWVRYTLEPKDRRKVLDAARNVAREVRKPMGASGSDGCTPEESAALLGFLKEFGPLGPVVGLVEPLPPMAHERDVRALNLTALRDQLHEIVQADDFIERTRSGRGAQEALWQTALPYLSEVTVRPVTRTGDVSYRVQPASLRAYLWMELCLNARISVGPRCMVCDRSLPRRSGRGRQREYCDEHNSEKFRDQVNQGNLVELSQDA